MAGSAIVPVHLYQPLEQAQILLVLEQRAGQRRHHQLVVGRAQRLGRDVLGQQQLEPVEQFGGRRFLLEPRHAAQLEEALERGAHQRLLDAGVVDLDDALHRRGIGELDVVEEAAAQEGVRQLLLVVRGDDHQRPVPRLHQLARFIHMELHAVELAQQVVGEFDVGLVDLVDQQHAGFVGLEGLPQHAAHDVVGDLLDALVAELGIAQPRDRVVFVETLLRLGGRLDVPLQQRHAERGGHFLGQHGLAGAGLALYQQRALQRQRGVDGELQIVGGDVLRGTFEAHGGLFPGEKSQYKSKPLLRRRIAWYCSGRCGGGLRRAFEGRPGAVAGQGRRGWTASSAARYNRADFRPACLIYKQNDAVRCLTGRQVFPSS
ncbi:hypothetical protein BGLA2_2490011 [Burkholderia gladioli]|nr:hypothetical protein BGLA2_2490011 [Burkholderia gladioli]